MGSRYKGQDLFGSGPHRFVIGRLGRRIVSLSTISMSPTVDGTAEFGDLELRIEVRGRLVANTESALWARRDLIVAQAESTIASGVLENEDGYQWATMKLLTFEESGPTQRGRDVSVGYVAVFGRLSSG